MKLTFFSKYHKEGASSRLRMYAYYDYMKSKGYGVDIQAFLYDGYVDDLYNNRKISKLKIISSYIKRMKYLWKARGSFVIEYELFTYFPFWIAEMFLNCRVYYMNYDDNVWESYKNKDYLTSKYDLLCKNATGVIVANDFLLEKVKKLNDNVIKIPTVLDIKPYQEEFNKYDKFTIVWVGTPVTYKYILSHKKMFQRLAKEIDYDLLIVASEDLEKIAGVNMMFEEWDEKKQIEFIKSSHIGVMPLDDDLFSAGKSSFKLLQYMAGSLPVVASNIGENNIVVKDGENGYLCSNDDEWIKSIVNLYKNDNLQAEFSIESHKQSFNYSLDKYLPIFEEFVSEQRYESKNKTT